MSVTGKERRSLKKKKKKKKKRSLIVSQGGLWRVRSSASYVKFALDHPGEYGFVSERFGVIRKSFQVI